MPLFSRVIMEEKTIEGEKQILSSALNLLARREHGFKELSQKLLCKGFDASLVDVCVTKLSEQGLQSDQRFAESFMRQRIAKYYGPVRIRYELYQKGVETQLIEALFQLPVDWFDIAQKAYKKRYSSSVYKHVDGFELKKFKARQFRYLQSRGFEAEQIQDVING